MRSKPFLARVMLLAMSSGAVEASVPETSPNVAVKSPGNVYEIASGTDGSAIVAGGFDSINGVRANGISRITAQGEVDLDWNVDIGGIVTAIEVGPDGSAYIAGIFDAVNDKPRSGLARIKPDGRLDDRWLPPALSDPSFPYDIAVGNDGAVYVAGLLFANGTYQPLMKLSEVDGTPDPAWAAADMPDNGTVYSLEIIEGAVFIGGTFTIVSGLPAKHLAKLSNTDGKLVQSWTPSPDGRVRRLVRDSDGFLYAAGRFRVIGGVNRVGVAKLDPLSGSVVGAWTPPAIEGLITDIVSLASGDLVIVGNITTPNSSTNSRAVGLSGMDGNVKWSVLAGPYEQIHYAAEAGTDGGLLVGGYFTTLNSFQRLSLGWVESDGTIGPRIDSEVPGTVSSLAKAPDGSLYMAGSFHSVAGEPRSNVAKLTSEGLVDLQWSADVPDGVNAISVHGDHVFLGGPFHSVNGEPAHYLARVAAETGALDSTWGPLPNEAVHVIEAAPDGGFFVGGEFGNIDGVVRRGLARFDAQGSLHLWDAAMSFGVHALAVDPTGFLYAGGDSALWKISIATAERDAGWDPAPQGMVTALQPFAGSVYAGGTFHTIGGEIRQGLAKILPSGAADIDWSPAPSEIHALWVDENGVVAAGDYSMIGGLPRRSLALLQHNGLGEPTAWNPDPDGPVHALLGDSSGSLFVAGEFGHIGTVARDAIARYQGSRLNVIFSDGFQPR